MYTFPPKKNAPPTKTVSTHHNHYNECSELPNIKLSSVFWFLLFLTLTRHYLPLTTDRSDSCSRKNENSPSTTAGASQQRLRPIWQRLDWAWQNPELAAWLVYLYSQVAHMLCRRDGTITNVDGELPMSIQVVLWHELCHLSFCITEFQPASYHLCQRNSLIRAVSLSTAWSPSAGMQG